MLQVGEQPLLVLLLVVQPEHHQFPDLFGNLTFQQFLHRLVHPAPVLVHLRYRGPREQPPVVADLDARVRDAEDRPVFGLDRSLADALAAQHEGLEVPGGVTHVPLRRARVRHRLDHVVLDGERRRELGGLSPDPPERVPKVGARLRLRHPDAAGATRTPSATLSPG